MLRRTPRYRPWEGSNSFLRLRSCSIQNFCIPPNPSLLRFLRPLCPWRAPRSFCASVRTPAPDEPLSTVAPLPIITAVVPAARPPLVVKIPGCCMKDASRRNDVPAAGAYGSSAADEAVHDIACVPDFRKKSTRSGRWREPGGDVADVAFSAGPSGGVQLSHLPDPRSVREAMAAPDADGWMVAMDLKMESLWSHDVFDPFPRASDMRTLRLGWVLHRNFKDGSFDKNKARLVARRNQQRPGIDYGDLSPPLCSSSHSASSSPWRHPATLRSSSLTSRQRTCMVP